MTVAIVGAGLAALRTAEALRQHHYDGDIVVVGAEPHLPYSRPPLSKEVLRGDAGPDAALLRDDAALAELAVDLRLGTSAAALRVAEREVVLSDATTVPFEHCVVATGAQPRMLPGVSLDGVCTLRTLDDCLTLRERLQPGAKVVVIGAGFIGLEVAASARARDADVTVVDVLPVPLARVLDDAVGDVVRRLHAEHGVGLRLGVGVEAVEGETAVERVRLGDGSILDCDTLVVGIGVAPTTGWLGDSGLEVDDGVVCDAALRAAPGVWAVGDVARWPHPTGSGTLRVEHWTNATEQPQLVARNIATGGSEPFVSVPYFWSDQYDAKLQSLGTVTRGDELRVVSGSLDEPKWVALVRSGDRLGGVVGLRAPGRVMKWRSLLAAGVSWSDAVDAG